ncbi:MAG: oligopeptide ABC transporter substrate-binding protein OppA [Chloroflexota bacterium]|nr:MAG: oligopeptide ABC transporter substrate-binding protein OppA [Chloroflexota bacterium]
MFSKKVVLLFLTIALLSLIAAQCSAAQPQQVTVVETVVVEKEVEKVVTKEVEVVKEVATDPDALPPEETLFYGGSNAGVGDIPTLDPSRIEDSVSIQFASELFIGLTHLSEETNETEPGIATEWEVSDDGLVYTFKLRDDVPWVKYNNATGEVEQVMDDEGNPRIVNANDFIYGIRRTQDPATAAIYAYVNYIVKNAAEVNGGGEKGAEDPLYGKVEEVGVRAVDDFTVEFTLTQPAAFFPAVASMWMNWALPEWLIAEKGDRWVEAGIIHTYGPYALKSWEHDVSVTLIANPFWPGSDAVPKPSIKYVHSQFLDQSAQFANYEAGLNDVSDVPLTELDRIRADATLSQELDTPGILCTYYYGFNVTKPPFDDVNVRKAFSWAIDRTALVENVTKGGQEPANYFSRPGLAAAPNPDEVDFGPPLTADLEKAKEFLAASTKYPDAEALGEITFMTNQVEGHVKIAEAIQQMWQEAFGVKVNLVTQEWKVFLETRHNDPPQIARNGWCQDYPDADNFLRVVLRSDSPNNDTRWANEEFDKLVDEAARETDLGKRKELYLQAERILVEEDAAIIPLYWYTRVELTKPYVTRTHGAGGQEAFEKWTLNK